MHEPVIFREYDIRGVFEKQFDLSFAEQLGGAFATYLVERASTPMKKRRVVLGHDARTSSPAIVAALTRGLQSSGFDVVLIGLVTSPICYFSTFHLPDVAGAIMVTGSHNPPEYNGFKVSVGKSTIFGEEIQKLRSICEEGTFFKGRGGLESIDILPAYIERYKSEFGVLKNFPVVLDCGNGAGGIAARRMFEAVGLHPEILFEKPDGTFPNHHPDPTVEENLVSLRERVLATGSRVGIGFDGDADRIGIVDHNGRMIFGDELMVIISRDILAKHRGSKIVGDVKCSDRMFADIASNGGEPIMWKTGHSLIKEKIRTEGAPFGGEMSGHIFFADRNYGYDDAIYAGLRLCEILSKTGKTITELLSGLPSGYSTPEIRIDTTEEKKVAVVNELKMAFSPKSSEYNCNLLDGIRITFKDGWALARASNTQPVLVLRFESTTEAGLKMIRDKIESIVRRHIEI